MKNKTKKTIRKPCIIYIFLSCLNINWLEIGRISVQFTIEQLPVRDMWLVIMSLFAMVAHCSLLWSSIIFKNKIGHRLCDTSRIHLSESLRSSNLVLTLNNWQLLGVREGFKLKKNSPMLLTYEVTENPFFYKVRHSLKIVKF